MKHELDIEEICTQGREASAEAVASGSLPPLLPTFRHSGPQEMRSFTCVIRNLLNHVTICVPPLQG